MFLQRDSIKSVESRCRRFVGAVALCHDGTFFPIKKPFLKISGVSEDFLDDFRDELTGRNLAASTAFAACNLIGM